MKGIGVRETAARLALIGGVLGLLAGAQPAQAQLENCANLEEVADDTFDLYIDTLDDEWGVDLGNEDLCGDLTQNFIKACTAAVKDAVKCLQNQLSALSKQQQTACKGLLSGDAAKDCANDAKDDAKFGTELVKQGGAEITQEECEEALAFDFFSICISGF